MNEIELLRRLLTEWYRKGSPWPKQPTLAMLAAKADREVRPLVNRLISDLGYLLKLLDGDFLNGIEDTPNGRGSVDLGLLSFPPLIGQFRGAFLRGHHRTEFIAGDAVANSLVHLDPAEIRMSLPRHEVLSGHGCTLFSGKIGRQ